jgi:mycofactocin glycosyltransferase
VSGAATRFAAAADPAAAAAVAAPAPAGLRLTPDPGTRFVAGGLVLVGGSPVRLLRLTSAGARQVRGWFSGTPVPGQEASRVLARRLLDAGLAHPAFTTQASPRTDPADSGAVNVSLDRPAVTVVIPVRDRHAELARCLAGLRADPPAGRGPGSALGARKSDPAVQGELGPAHGARGSDPVVIVVDDASANPGVIAAIAAAHGARVIHRPVNGGPGAARNTGLAAASTELVAFLDSDCVPEAGWLDRLLPHFADPALGAVAPRIVPHRAGTSWLARYEGASSTLDMGARPSIVRPGARVPYVPGAALVVRRSAAGAGFADGMFVGEDVDFIWRLSAAGWRVRYEPSATMGHDHRVRFRAWFSRRADYGTSAAALEQRHPGSVRPLYASWWTVGAWAAALSGRPVTAAALTAAATALLARRLSAITSETWPLPTPTPPRSSTPPWPPTSDNSKKRSARRNVTDSSKGRGAGAPGGPCPARRAEAWRLAARLAGGGTLAAARPIGSALSRTWWPLAIPAAIAFPRLRRPVAALILLPPLLDWADRRPPLDPARYVAARLLDDAAYSLGVWHGCLKRRTIKPLLPVVGGRRRVTRTSPRPAASTLSRRSSGTGHPSLRCLVAAAAPVTEVCT